VTRRWPDGSPIGAEYNSSALYALATLSRHCTALLARTLGPSSILQRADPCQCFCCRESSAEARRLSAQPRKERPAPSSGRQARYGAEET